MIESTILQFSLMIIVVLLGLRLTMWVNDKFLEKRKARTRRAEMQEKMRRNREAIRKHYGDLFNYVGKILHDSDLMGLIISGAPADEYDPEVETILPRLIECNSPTDVRNVISEEFDNWFGGTYSSYADQDKLNQAAEEIWEAWMNSENSKLS